MAEIRISYKVEYFPRRGKLQDSLQFDLQFFKDFCTPQFSTYKKKRHNLRHILGLIIDYCESWF